MEGGQEKEVGAEWIDGAEDYFFSPVRSESTVIFPLPAATVAEKVS